MEEDNVYTECHVSPTALFADPHRPVYGEVHSIALPHISVK